PRGMVRGRRQPAPPDRGHDLARGHRPDGAAPRLRGRERGRGEAHARGTRRPVPRLRRDPALGARPGRQRHRALRAALTIASPRGGCAAGGAAGERATLARGAPAIARIGPPELDPAPSLARLDTLAAGARPHLAGGMPPEEAAAALAGYLFGACGFRGN